VDYNEFIRWWRPSDRFSGIDIDAAPERKRTTAALLPF